MRVAAHDEVMYHIELSRAMIDGAVTAIVPGAPERAKAIAERLDRSRPLADHRGLASYLGYIDNAPVIVQTTGMGGPTLEIVVNELLMLGVRTFLRVGTTGSIQPEVKAGSLVITEGAVRIDGTSDHYAPPAYPAVADLDLTVALRDAARAAGVPHAVGITASSASFYAGQQRFDSGTGWVPRAFRGSLDEWRGLGVLNYEMEAATLFTLARIARARAGCVCAVVAERDASEAVRRDLLDAAVDAAVAVGVDALRRDLVRERG